MVWFPYIIFLQVNSIFEFEEQKKIEDRYGSLDMDIDLDSVSITVVGRVKEIFFKYIFKLLLQINTSCKIQWFSTELRCYCVSCHPKMECSNAMRTDSSMNPMPPQSQDVSSFVF